MAGQKARWVTLKNGTHIFIDENGIVTKGPKDFLKKNIAELDYDSDATPVPKKPSRKFSAYLEESKGAFHKAALKYYQKEMQGHYVDAFINREKEQVFFTSATSGSKNDLQKYLEMFPIKAELVPYIPKVIRYGRQVDIEPCAHERDDYKCFYVFKKRVRHKEEEYDVTVKVGERLDGEKVFRFHYFGQNKSTAQDFSISCAHEPQTRPEIVQYPTQEKILGFFVEEVKPIFSGQFEGLNRIKV